jgi:hypothetical protein
MTDRVADLDDPGDAFVSDGEWRRDRAVPGQDHRIDIARRRGHRRHDRVPVRSQCRIRRLAPFDDALGDVGQFTHWP